MKTLFLVRHAKSSRDDPTLPDRERPWGDRGRRDAPSMGRRLAERDVRPELIMSSPARRALTTAQLVADEIDYAREDIVVDDRLYASSASDLLAVNRALDEKLDSVMLFGHNPEFTDLAHRLSSEIIDMPTCAVAKFRFDTKAWSDVGDIEPKNAMLETPQGSSAPPMRRDERLAKVPHACSRSNLWPSGDPAEGPLIGSAANSQSRPSTVACGQQLSGELKFLVAAFRAALG